MLQSKVLTSNGQVKTGPGAVYALIVAAGGADATGTLYDNTAGSGTKLAKLSASQGDSQVVHIDDGVVFVQGCYAAMTGSGVTVTVVYR